ncbi:MAG: hypothetical protein P8X89_23730, partial [Reinekea sp.]
QPETGQTFGGGAASGASWNYPGQPYQDFNVQAQIPFSPGLDWESALRTPQPMAMEDLIHGQIYQQDGQYSSHETGQTSAGGPASEPWWSQPTPGQLQPYQDSNFPAQIPPSLGSDLEYLQRAPQPMVLDDTIQNDTSLEPSNPQPAAAPRRRRAPANGRPPAKERILASLEAFAQGVDLKDCSSAIRLSDYIKTDGSLAKRGRELYDQFTDAEKTLLKQATIDRQKALFEGSVQERFLAGLDNYAQGVPLAYCSTTIEFRHYVTDSGHLNKEGKALFKSLSENDQERVREALRSRSEISSRREIQNPSEQRSLAQRFLADLDNYEQDVPVVHCSTTIDFSSYVSDNGELLERGSKLRDRMSVADQARFNRALLARRDCYDKRIKDHAPVEKRFLASLDNYASGQKLSECGDIPLRNYITEDGRLRPHPYQGQPLYNSLSRDDKRRVDQALAARRRMAAEQISGDLPHFMAALEPYSNGVDLLTCTIQSGLKRKAERYKKIERYLTEEGGLTPKGELLIENLSSDQQNYVKDKVEQRRQHMNPSAQVPESPWQQPEIPASMPGMGGMAPASMVDPMQTETMVDPMQTESMWSAVWQMTGQAAPGIWGTPSESAEPPMPSYGNEAFGGDYQHYYGAYADQYPGRGV